METASRTTGFAPLAVQFSAMGTSTGVTQPDGGSFNNAHYAWNFGDADSGAWQTDGHSRNCATGFVSGHVFVQPGTYAVRLSATQPGASTEFYTQQIEVLDPATADAWVTYYVSAAGSDDNEGTSETTPLATFAHALSLAAPNTRILFRSGDTWQTEGVSLDTDGPGIIGAYGEGPAPVIEFTSGDGVQFGWSSGNRGWRFVGLRWMGTGSSVAFFAEGNDLSEMLIWDMDIENWAAGIVLSAECDRLDQNAIGASTIRDINDAWTIYIGGTRSFVQGNVLDKQTTESSHTMRNWCPRVFSATHNYVGPALHHSLKLHGASDPPYSHDVVIADNVFEGSVWTVAMGPQDEGSDERIEHVLYERNTHLRTDGTGASLMVWARDVTIRNNVFINNTGGSFGPLGITQRGIEPPPANNRVYHNTFFAEQGTITPVTVGSTATGTDVRNNLLAPASDFLIDDSSSDLVASNNVATESSDFTDAAGYNFALLPDSSAVNAGTDVGVLVDRVGTLRDENPDVGAYELATD